MRPISALAYEQRVAVVKGELKPGCGGGVMVWENSRDAPAEIVKLPPVATLGVVRHKGLWATLIAWGTRSPWNHCVMYLGEVDGGGVHGPAVLEARPNGAVVTPLTRVIADIASGTIKEFGWALDMPEFYEASSGSEGWLSEDEVRHQVAQIGLAMVGTPYSWFGVFCIGLLQFGIRFGWAVREVQKMDRAFCSQLYAVACMGAGVRLSGGGAAPIWDVSPGDLGRNRPLWDMTGRPLRDR